MALSEAQSFADLIRQSAERFADSEALVFAGRRTSYRDLDDASNRVAQGLIAQGISPGDRVVYFAKNTDYFYEIWFGCVKAGAVVTPLNYRLATPEIAFVLSDCAPKLAFVAGEFLDTARSAMAELNHAPEIIVFDDAGNDVTSYPYWRNAFPADDPKRAGRGEDEVIQVYTSGTTANPKGVQHTHKGWLSFSHLCPSVDGLAYKPGESVINAMPFFHVAGLNVGIAGLCQGSRLIIVDDIVPSKVLELIETEAVNHAFFVPSVIAMLLSSPDIDSRDTTSLKSIAYGASPISEALLLAAQDRFKCDFLQFYGMTETTGAGASLAPADHDPEKNRLRSCGRPWPGVEMRVVDAHGLEVTQGDVGEILIRTPTLMKGYYNNPGATRDAVRGGWMHTGDAAFQDEDGYFFICDRIKDMIVTGGENVYPAEVENALAAHPDIADIAVIGVPDPKWGEAVKAIVVAQDGARQSADEIITWARALIANYKIPKTIDFVETIPRNPSGKILRRVLRAPFWAKQQRDVS